MHAAMLPSSRQEQDWVKRDCYWDGQRHHPYATEGGHTSFCPQNDLEIDLLRYLQRLYGHVSWERVVSGMGLVDLHQFLARLPQISRAAMVGR